MAVASGDAADEGPGAILQAVWNSVVAVFRREDAMNAERDAGMGHVNAIYHVGLGSAVPTGLRTYLVCVFPALTCRAGFWAESADGGAGKQAENHQDHLQLRIWAITLTASSGTQIILCGVHPHHNREMLHGDCSAPA